MESRKEPRFDVRIPVQLTLLGATEVTAPGHVLDVSCNGARIRVVLPLPCGSRLKIADGNSLIFGEVVWCNAAGGAHVIGVSFSRWTSLPSDEHRSGKANGR